MKNTKTILFITPVHWNYYPYRDQELPSSLAEKGYPGIYLNPLQYKGYEKATRFARVNKRATPANVVLVDRSTGMRKSFLTFLHENLLNVKEIKVHKPAAVYCSSHLSGLFACFYCRLKKIKFIYDVTDDWERVDRSMAGTLYKFFFKYLLAKMAFAVTATSYKQFSFFDRRRKNNTFYIPNGIAPLMLQQLENIAENLPEQRQVNFIGSLRPWYDFDLLFEVFAAFPDIALNIYGRGELLDDLKVKSKVHPNIKVHGNIDSSETPALIKKSIFGILPLKMTKLNDSTCPVKLFEYWGASKAVIATPVSEVARLGAGALLFAGNKTEYIEKINLLLQNPHLMEELGRTGHQKVVERHNYTTITNQFIDIIES